MQYVTTWKPKFVWFRMVMILLPLSQALTGQLIQELG